jgi:hypothetical protein
MGVMFMHHLFIAALAIGALAAPAAGFAADSPPRSVAAAKCDCCAEGRHASARPTASSSVPEPSDFVRQIWTAAP